MDAQLLQELLNYLDDIQSEVRAVERRCESMRRLLQVLRPEVK